MLLDAACTLRVMQVAKLEGLLGIDAHAQMQKLISIASYLGAAYTLWGGGGGWPAGCLGGGAAT